jgi:hypothetical protein
MALNITVNSVFYVLNYGKVESFESTHDFKGWVMLIALYWIGFLIIQSLWIAIKKQCNADSNTTV